ncbi:MAG: hypothetical protein GWN07_12040, partial [Actinobacteria bacterium]|nr:hypothetical protein [Actinomycetota bacterium]NIV55626.1 hypothetical protein [Actinomycetota bacterium]NIV87021.1 hypothetical protein [Actinomycetota bacterium]NIX20515.1 hypothetical protein [Actinomycetota bacterium]NIX50439.1 hypothetical protein [Actinomycetota bacterium]
MGDVILFDAPTGPGLWLVSASGGTPRAVTAPDDTTDDLVHVAPTVLPDGETALFTVT